MWGRVNISSCGGKLFEGASEYVDGGVRGGVGHVAFQQGYSRAPRQKASVFLSPQGPDQTRETFYEGGRWAVKSWSAVQLLGVWCVQKGPGPGEGEEGWLPEQYGIVQDGTTAAWGGWQKALIMLMGWWNARMGLVLVNICKEEELYVHVDYCVDPGEKNTQHNNNNKKTQMPINKTDKLKPHNSKQNPLKTGKSIQHTNLYCSSLVWPPHILEQCV